MSWLLGGDTASDFAVVVVTFAGYALLDGGSRLVANIDPSELFRSVLLLGAIASNPVAYAALLVAFGVALRLKPERIWARWSDLEQGTVLRLLVAPLVLLVAWQSSLYEFNFMLDRTHLGDRLLVAVLALACLARPLFLVPFVIESRIIANQFEFPFATTAAQNIDELLLIALSAVAAAHLLYVVTGRRETAPVFLVLSAAVAAHFYIPGSTKLANGWFLNNDLSNLPLSGYTAGWQGDGDGGWAEQMSGIVDSLGRFGLAATMLLELGSMVALLHYRLLRIWLPACIAFHIVVFAFVGFWFLPWIALEVTLIVVATRSSLRSWLDQNVTPARTILTLAAVVLLGGVLFHPPTLSWLDAPVSYGYRIEATGDSGTRYQVPTSAFAPYQQEIAFFRLKVATDEPVSGAYGALGSKETLEDLAMVQVFQDVKSLEVASTAPDRALAKDFMVRFLEHANAERRTGWSILSPPNHFWTGTATPTFDFEEPLKQLDVYVLTSIHHNGQQRFERELVLTLTVGSDGNTVSG